MVATNGRTVTVFGGTGFLGRRIVRHLRCANFPLGSRQGMRIGAQPAWP
jgi:nucleoside-diphosphate-sugar epimerase